MDLTAFDGVAELVVSNCCLLGAAVAMARLGDFLIGTFWEMCDIYEYGIFKVSR